MNKKEQKRTIKGTRRIKQNNDKEQNNNKMNKRKNNNKINKKEQREQ